jgi:hypothetical protein
VVAVLVGILVGGGLMAVTPAGAEVSSALATNWKKIWNKELKPQADKRYYTKKKSDKRYEAAGSGYTKAETYSKAEADAKYQPKGSYALNGSSYTKAESDAKYAPYPKTIRGTYMASDTVPAAGFVFSSISYGATLNTAPTVVFKPLGGPANANCTGTAAAPAAAPGFLCIYEGAATNADSFTSASAAGSVGVSSPFGLIIRFSAPAAGLSVSLGGWAVTPGNGVSSARPAPQPESGAGGVLVN